MIPDERTLSAARNNADWYEAVFAAHGVRYRRLPEALVALDQPPPYYSHLVTLQPGEVRAHLAGLATKFRGRVGLKDSFCRLDLGEHGFSTLFQASWIWRAPRPGRLPPGWEIVRDARGLARWEQGWTRNGSPADRRMFPDSLLQRNDVTFLARTDGDRVVVGCIANRSADCIGLSNSFAEGATAQTSAEAAGAVAAIAGPLPVVGYESGTDLAFALAAGFEEVGPLRILVAEAARF
jgi:hypothetical protein